MDKYLMAEQIYENSLTARISLKKRNFAICPLLKGPCNPDCECFNPGRIAEITVNDIKHYKVVQPACENAMFHKWSD